MASGLCLLMTTFVSLGAAVIAAVLVAALFAFIWVTK
jgi:hypothetical protein